MVFQKILCPLGKRTGLMSFVLVMVLGILLAFQLGYLCLIQSLEIGSSNKNYSDAPQKPCNCEKVVSNCTSAGEEKNQEQAETASEALQRIFFYGSDREMILPASMYQKMPEWERKNLIVSRNKQVIGGVVTDIPQLIKKYTSFDRFKHSKYGKTLKELLQVKTRFYVYDDPEIDQPGSVYKENIVKIDYYDMGKDGETDSHILACIKKHPLRTWDPQEADQFVIPFLVTPVHALHGNITHYDTESMKKVHHRAFTKLFNTSSFQKTQGHRHLMISTWWYYFEWRMVQDFEELYIDTPLTTYYEKLWNVTLVASKDRPAIARLYDHNTHPDYQKWFELERFQMTRSVFAVGQHDRPSLPIIEPTYENFKAKKLFLFYHIRPTDYRTPNSTDFRRALLETRYSSQLPPSSIGYDIPKDEYFEHVVSSKFCLLVRGDDPGSHSLLRAIRIGCIPVMVSDVFWQYSPTFKSTIGDISDFSFIIPEALFIQNPLKEIKKLETLSEDAIRDKLEGMAWAQRVMIPDHPQSLFVPAFLREAIFSQKSMRPETTMQKYRNLNPVPDLWLDSKEAYIKKRGEFWHQKWSKELQAKKTGKEWNERIAKEWNEESHKEWIEKNVKERMTKNAKQRKEKS